MYCPNCKNEVQNNVAFCPYCGMAMPSNDGGTTVLNPNPAAAPYNAQPAQNYQQGVPQGYQQNVNPAYQQPVQNYQQPVNPAYQQPAQGYQQAPQNNYQQPAAQPFQQPVAVNAPNKAPKKGNKKILGIIVAVALVVVIAIIVLGGGSDSGSDSSVNTDSNISTTVNQDSGLDINEVVQNDAASAEFQALLDDNNITSFNPIITVGNSVAYGGVSDGMVDIHEFVYSDDKVSKWVETLYTPMPDSSAETAAIFEKSMREGFGKFEEMECCTVDYFADGDKYVVRITFDNLNDVSNINALQQNGFIEDGFALYLSLSQTVSGLITDGYVKR